MTVELLLVGHRGGLTTGGGARAITLGAVWLARGWGRGVMEVAPILKVSWAGKIKPEPTLPSSVEAAPMLPLTTPLKIYQRFLVIILRIICVI